MPSVTRSTSPDTATAPFVYEARDSAAFFEDSTESVASTPRTPSLSMPESSPQRFARAIISEALPLITDGGHSFIERSRLSLNEPTPIPTGSRTHGFEFFFNTLITLGRVSAYTGRSVPMLM